MSDSEKRKRVTFWESDIPEVREWCKAQTNLGTSFDLIITDAVHRYGNGDIIKAYLNQRHMNMLSQSTSSDSSQFVSHEPESSKRHLSSYAPQTEEPALDRTDTRETFREHAKPESREHIDPSGSEGISDQIRREAASSPREQGDPSGSGAVADLIRRESTSSPKEQNHLNESDLHSDKDKDSISSADNLSIFLGGTDSHMI